MSTENPPKSPFLRVTELAPQPQQLRDGVYVVPDCRLDSAIQGASRLAAAAGPQMVQAVDDLNAAWCAEIEAIHYQLARVAGFEVDQGEELPKWGELMQIVEADHDVAFQARLLHETIREQTDPEG